MRTVALCSVDFNVRQTVGIYKNYFTSIVCGELLFSVQFQLRMMREMP